MVHPLAHNSDAHASVRVTVYLSSNIKNSHSLIYESITENVRCLQSRRAIQIDKNIIIDTTSSIENEKMMGRSVTRRHLTDSEIIFLTLINK